MLGNFKHAALGLLAVVALGTCAACSTFTSQTYDAVVEGCLSLDVIDDEALCLIGAAGIAIDELAEAREDGELDPAVIEALDPVINQVGPRLEAAALLWGGVVGYKAQVEAAKDAVSAEDYLELTALLQESTATAVSDWASLRPQVIELVTLKEHALKE